MEEPKFPVADLLNDACKFCATFARAKLANFMERRFVPRAGDDTATVSFIEFEGNTYAVTADHVIKGFKRQAGDEGIELEGYFLPAAPGATVSPPFLQPPTTLTHPQPDVALRPINPT